MPPYETVTVPAVPLNVAEMLALPPVNVGVTALPLNVGCVEVAEDIPLTTVVLLPFVGSVPASNVIVSVSFETDVVSDGSEPTAVIEFTVVVLGVTVMVGVLTVPAGVMEPIVPVAVTLPLTVPAGV